jgi:signal transduction histidine kinase
MRAWIRANTFVPVWMPHGWTHPAIPYAAALFVQVVAVAATCIIVWAFPGFAFRGALFDLAVVFVATSFGAGPGLIATCAGAFLLSWAVLPPQFMLLPKANADTFGMLLAFLVAVSSTQMVSQRERARRVALDAVRRMDAFLGIASHELRTPMTTLKLTIHIAQRRLRQVLHAETTDTAGARQQLEQVLALLERADIQLQRQNRLVIDLLDASRLQTNRFTLNRQRIDLVPLVRMVTEEQRLAHPECVLTLDLPENREVLAMVDPDRIAQLLSNYLDNALKYSAPAAPIDISLIVEGDQARVQVRDHGPGLSAEAQRQVWDLFHRVEGIEVQAGSSVGLGLGLYISKAIAEQHGGQVGVESAPGTGATFWFTLPLLREAT